MERACRRSRRQPLGQAPLLEQRLHLLHFEDVPVVQQMSAAQQVLDVAEGAGAIEEPLDPRQFRWTVVADELQHQRLARIEFLPVRDAQVVGVTFCPGRTFVEPRLERSEKDFTAGSVHQGPPFAERGV